MALGWLQLTYSCLEARDAQCHDSEYITQTCNRNHIGIVSELCIALAVF